MAKSKETFGKKEKEKQRLKHRQDKFEKKQERKANAQKGKPLEEMMAYVDENGNLTSTPPDPKKKKVFRQEDIPVNVAHREEEDVERVGIINSFITEKGYGFIRDLKTNESIFFHTSKLIEPVKEKDKVSYQVEHGAKGLNAIQVKKAN